MKPRVRYNEATQTYDLRSFENPNTSLADPDAWLTELMGGGPSSSGVRVSESTAMRLSTVMACVLVISETMAHLPLHMQRRIERGWEVDREHPLHYMLHTQPNLEMTAFTWRQTLQSHLMLWGNWYAFIVFGNDGRARELIPLLPDRTWPERIDGKLVYRTMTDAGAQIVLDPGEVLHVPGLGFDGMAGHSVIGMQRDTIGIGVAARDYGAKLFSQGYLSGIVTYPGKFKDSKALNDFQRAFSSTYGSLSNAAKTAVLERGMDYKPLGIPAQDAQHVENRKYNRAEIASIFRVPLHLIQDLEHSAVRANIEQQDTNFAKHSILPNAVRWEQELDRKLLLPRERGNYGARFNLEGLLRGDSKSRAEYYANGIQWGYLKRNEARQKENLPIDDTSLDEYLVPVNMVGSTALPTEKPESDADIGSRASAFLPLLQAVDEGLARREAAALPRLFEKYEGERLVEEIARFCETQQGYIERHGEPVWRTIAEAVPEWQRDPSEALTEALRRYRVSFADDLALALDGRIDHNELVSRRAVNPMASTGGDA